MKIYRLFDGTFKGRVSQILIPVIFLAVLSAPLFSVSPFDVSDMIPVIGDKESDQTGIPSLEDPDKAGEVPCPVEGSAAEYFDPDDYMTADYSRNDYVLLNRGSDPDPDSLLFGNADESDMEGGLKAPPDMTFKEDDTTIYVHYGTLNLRELPTSDSKILHVFKLGDRMTRTGIGVEWSRVIDPEGREGYVFNELTGLAKPTPTPTPVPKYTAPAKANTLGEAIAMEAQRYLGVPYVWAKADPKIGFDCSGLTWYVLNRYGIDSPRGTSTYYNAGTIVPYSNIAPGDIISWDVWRDGSRIDHVGIYIGGGMMVHASSNRANKKVVKVSVAEYAKYCKIVRIHRFYKN